MDDNILYEGWLINKSHHLAAHGRQIVKDSEPVSHRDVDIKRFNFPELIHLKEILSWTLMMKNL